MNAGPTAERVYDTLKRRVTLGALRPGTRLDPAALADDLSASATPVREALHRLTGERLVETRVSDGFHIPVASAPALEDLYDWSAQLLLLALRQRQPAAADRAGSFHEESVPIAERTAMVFDHIVAATGNHEHRAAMQSANDHLLAARVVESHVLPDTTAELAALVALLQGAGGAALRRAITSYHRRRRRIASELVRLLYRSE